MNVSAGLGVLFDFLREGNREMDAGNYSRQAAQGALEALGVMDQVLAVLEPDAQEVQVPPEVQALAEERQAARKAKEWARADELRAAIEQAGWMVKDTPKGPQLLRK